MKQLRCSADYGYRTNDDGSTDLICLYCGDTVFSTSVPAELPAAEDEHVCEAKMESKISVPTMNRGTRGRRVM